MRVIRQARAVRLMTVQNPWTVLRAVPTSRQCGMLPGRTERTAQKRLEND